MNYQTEIPNTYNEKVFFIRIWEAANLLSIA